MALHERNWYLHVRVPTDATPSQGASWTWSPSVFSHARKGVCQDFAEGKPRGPSPAAAPSDNPQNVPGQRPLRPALDNWEPSSPQHNARCYHCGVPFVRGPYGDFCSRGCLDTVREILTEATTAHAS